MKYPRILAALRSASWAIAPATLNAVFETFSAHLRGDLTHRALGLELPEPSAEDTAEQDALAASGIARITIDGVIGKHLSTLETACGACDVDRLSEAVSAAAANPSIHTILLDIDSPGGVVTGVPELADQIREASATHGKQTIAFTDTQAASAAYWLASACDYIACTPTAEVGSVGVYMALVDESANWAAQGYKLELIKAGDLKAIGMRGKPITSDERAHLQSQVDEIYRLFASDVQAGRGGSIETAALQGQTFMGRQAADNGLVDEIYPNLNALLDAHG